MDQIEWCKKQEKGIKITEPNELMAKDYFIKADNSLIMINTVPSKDWKAIGSYYACYNALYALLQKAGIKCEIHECSIALMKFFGFSNSDIDFIKELKTDRTNAQYYIDKEFKVGDLNKVKDFVLKCKKIFNEENFKEIRKKIIQIVKK